MRTEYCTVIMAKMQWVTDIWAVREMVLHSTNIEHYFHFAMSLSSVCLSFIFLNPDLTFNGAILPCYSSSPQLDKTKILK